MRRGFPFLAAIELSGIYVSHHQSQWINVPRRMHKVRNAAPRIALRERIYQPTGSRWRDPVSANLVPCQTISALILPFLRTRRKVCGLAIPSVRGLLLLPYLTVCDEVVEVLTTDTVSAGECDGDDGSRIY
jgi:hypothetical protein